MYFSISEILWGKMESKLSSPSSEYAGVGNSSPAGNKPKSYRVSWVQSGSQWVTRRPFHSLFFQYVSTIEFSLASVFPAKLSEETTVSLTSSARRAFTLLALQWDLLSRGKHKNLFSLHREKKKWFVWSPQLCHPWWLWRIERADIQAVSPDAQIPQAGQ